MGAMPHMGLIPHPKPIPGMNIRVFVSLSGISRSSYQGGKGSAIELLFYAASDGAPESS
jgi:hypothetical protein